ncbi:MAG TPA: DUF3034 family protein [Rhizomicrobium sp.]|nr:DUF3034 family protein [Rhizomicrobium sp.]
MRSVLPAFLASMALAWPALADDQAPPSSMAEQGMAMFDSGKLLATGGVSQLEGAGGGGLTTWALISGYGTRDGLGANGHFTYIGVGDYSLWTEGAAIGLFDRVELSYAYQSFDTQDVGAKLGLGKNFTIDQDVFGAKVKVWGDAVYDQDSLLPQISAGVQYKHNDKGWLISAIGGKSADGTDFYVAATKLFLAQSLLVDATLRETKANQFGFLGFGGDKNDSYSTEFEGTAAYLLSRNFAIGGEYRTKPDNLGIAREDDAWDLFAAYFLNKNLSLTVAYVDLGNIVIEDHQRGVYVSLQAGL